jgi:hypothetical protein
MNELTNFADPVAKPGIFAQTIISVASSDLVRLMQVAR